MRVSPWHVVHPSGNPQSRPVGVPEGIASAIAPRQRVSLAHRCWFSLSEELHMTNGTQWNTATLSRALLVLAVMAPVVFAQVATPYAQINAEAASSAITVRPVRGNISALQGAGGNIG